jgi:hypothetical protein
VDDISALSRDQVYYPLARCEGGADELVSLEESLPHARDFRLARGFDLVELVRAFFEVHLVTDHVD